MNRILVGTLEQCLATNRTEGGGAVREQHATTPSHVDDDLIVCLTQAGDAIAPCDKALLNEPGWRGVAERCSDQYRREMITRGQTHEFLQHVAISLGRNLERNVHRRHEAVTQEAQAARGRLPEIAPYHRLLAGNPPPKHLTNSRLLPTPHVVPSEVDGHDVRLQALELTSEPLQAMKRSIADDPGIQHLELFCTELLIEHGLQHLRVGLPITK